MQKSGQHKNFVIKMNEMARNMGMIHSTFKNPSGLTEKEQLSTSYDLSLLTLRASANANIVRIWKKNNHYFSIKGKNERIMTIHNTVCNAQLNNYYSVLGGKTGTVGFIKNLSVLVYSQEKIYVATILKASGNRFHQMKLLMDSLFKSELKDIDANAYTVTEYPRYPVNIFTNIQLKSLVSKNETIANNPASVTKLLTILTAFEYPLDLNDTVQIQEEDIVEDHLNKILVGDILSLDDILHLMLLSSSNISANALSRYITEKYLY